MKNENKEKEFYIHNLFCYICNCYYFNNIEFAEDLVINSIKKFYGSKLLNFLISLFIFNKFKKEYTIIKSEYDLYNIKENGSWGTDLLSMWDSDVTYFDCFEGNTPLDIRKLYSDFLMKNTPCILVNSVKIDKLKEELSKDNFVKKYGDNMITNHLLDESLTISSFIENMNKSYFFHEGYDNMTLDFFHEYYTPPIWYLKYNHLWGKVEFKDDNILFERFEKPFEENKIVLKPQLYFGTVGSGMYFNSSNGFIDTLVYGKRRWFIYDPSMYILIYNSGLNTWSQDCGDIETWLDTYYDKLNPKPYTCIQNAEETIYVPCGWYYMNINLCESIGIKLNIGTHKMIIDTFFEVRKIPELVSTGLTLK